VFLVLAALAVTVSGAGADNLVLNPGFESPHQNGDSWVDTGSPLANWSAGDGLERLIVGYWPPHSGTQSLALIGGWISQDLVTVAGGTYDLSFFMSGSSLVWYQHVRTLEVFWGGAPLGTVSFDLPTDGSMGWTLKSGGALSGLTATGPSTELRFVGGPYVDYYNGPALDEISVTLDENSSVPEPASASLLLLGLPGLAWLRRRRRA
jgi:hypothetical protein